MSSIRISSALLYLLLVVLGITAAQLTWKLAALEDVNSLQPSIRIASDKGHSSARDNLNAIKIISANTLFGQPIKALATVVNKIAAPKKLQKTKLNIRLTGLLNGDPSVAVIVYKGEQGAYLVNEYIVHSNHLKVQLDSIEHNFVIISNNGIQERLSLPQSNTKTLAQTGIIVKPAAASAAPENNVSVDLNSPKIQAILGATAKKIIRSNPLALSNFLRISPNIQQGKLQGYVISAGPDERLLQAARIRPGDIITHIGGKAVASLTLPSVYQTLNSSNSLIVTVDRSGTIITMDIKL